jgi:transposase
VCCAEGLENKDVSARLGVGPHTVGKWLRRFLARRVEGLHDKAKTGDLPRFSACNPTWVRYLRANIVPLTPRR